MSTSTERRTKDNTMSMNTDQHQAATKRALDLLAAMQSPDAVDLAASMVAEFGDTVAASRYCWGVGYTGVREVNPALVDRYRAAHAIIEERIQRDTLRAVAVVCEK